MAETPEVSPPVRNLYLFYVAMKVHDGPEPDYRQYSKLCAMIPTDTTRNGGETHGH